MTRLELVSSGVVDLVEDVAISLNYSISDIREPDKRKTSFSKSITIPGTKNNNDLLKHIYEIDIDSNFNPKVRAAINLYQDSQLIMDGYMQLKDIIQNGNRIDYVVVLLGENAGFFNAIDGKLLTDIDLSSLDHTFNISAMQNSWVATTGVGYVYPLTDNGYTDGVTWDIEGLSPAVYAKQYVDKIFSDAGYTYTSTFFSSDYFSRLVIPFTSGQKVASQSALDDRFVNVDYSINTVHTAGSIGSNQAYDQEVADTGNNYNLSNNLYTIASTGKYHIEVLNNYGAFSANVISYSVSVAAFSNGVIKPIYQSANIPAQDSTEYYIKTPSVDLLTGDQVTVNLAFLTTTSNGTVTVNAGSYAKFTAESAVLITGDTIEVNNTIPLKVKQTDFITSLIKMHNLYVDIDKNNSRNLLIETRNDFYGTTKVDWTDKLDTNSPLSIKPLGELTARRYVYKYKDGKDYYNRDYQETYQEAYGTKFWNTDNEYLKNDKTTDVIFSPTIMVGDRSVNVGGTIYGLIYPSLSNKQYNEPSINLPATNIRILYFGGLINSPAWNIRTRFGSVGIGILGQSFYPYCGHLNDINTPTIDLNFGVPEKLYFNTASYTNGNLFNTYYKQFIEEITDKDSKIIEGVFRLTATDIANLDFRKLYIVDGHYLRLNQIKEYNPNTEGLSKVEFIKVKDTASFTATTSTINGGIGGTF